MSLNNKQNSKFNSENTVQYCKTIQVVIPVVAEEEEGDVEDPEEDVHQQSLGRGLKQKRPGLKVKAHCHEIFYLLCICRIPWNIYMQTNFCPLLSIFLQFYFSYYKAITKKAR